MATNLSSERRTDRVFAAVLVLTLLVVVIGSCGSVQPKTTKSGTKPSTKPKSGETPPSSIFVGLFCPEFSLLRSAEERYATSDSPIALKQSMTEVVTALGRVTIAAPAPARQNFLAMQSALDPAVKLFEEYGYDFQAMAADVAVSEQLGILLKDFEAASFKVDAVGARECAVPLPSS
jgi:hypothetical protein